MMKKKLLVFLILSVLLLLPVLPAAAAGHPPRVVDGAGLLSGSEVRQLTEKLDRISDEKECDVILCTTDSLDGKSAEAYADDFFDYNGYGYEGSEDGILFVVSMEDRDWAISTSGYGITAFTDAGQELMIRKVRPYLSEGSYYEAFDTYADVSEDLLARARDGKPYDISNEEDTSRGVSPFWIFGDAGIGLGTAFAGASRKKRKLKTVYKKQKASTYLMAGGIGLALSMDDLVGTSVTHRTIRRDRDDRDDHHGSGGSSVHTSSSGHTHGGSSGKF